MVELSSDAAMHAPSHGLKGASSRLIARELRRIDDLFIAHLGIHLLSSQARLITYLIIHDAASITQGRDDSPVSYKAFHDMVKRLLHDDLVSYEIVPRDRRKKLIKLSPRVKSLLHLI